MEQADAHCHFVELPGALHGFSNPLATANGTKYNLPWLMANWPIRLFNAPRCPLVSVLVV